MLLQFNQVYKKHNKNFNIINFNLFQFIFNKIEIISLYLEMLYAIYCDGIDLLIIVLGFPWVLIKYVIVNKF